MDAVALLRQIEGRTGYKVELNRNDWGVKKFQETDIDYIKEDDVPLLRLIAEEKPDDHQSIVELKVEIGAKRLWYGLLIEGSEYFRKSEFNRIKRELGLALLKTERSSNYVISTYAVHLATA